MAIEFFCVSFSSSPSAGISTGDCVGSVVSSVGTVVSSSSTSCEGRVASVADVSSSPAGTIGSWLIDGTVSSGFVGVETLPHPARGMVIDKASIIATIRNIIVRFIFFSPRLIGAFPSFYRGMHSTNNTVQKNGLVMTRPRCLKVKKFFHLR